MFKRFPAGCLQEHRKERGNRAERSGRGKAAALLLIVFLFMLPSALSAVTLKLASPFPEGSAWDTALKRMAAEWADISGGQVRIRIYPGGVAGDEGNMVRKMRFGQLDLAVLSSFGMKEIVPDSFVITLPGLLQSEEELDMVLDEFVPVFDEAFIGEGFRVLSWSRSGWAYLFAKEPLTSMDIMRQNKFAVNSSDLEMAEIFKSLDFKVVPTSMNEVMVGLQSGMISAYYTAPVAAAVYQWFALAPCMLDVPVAPVFGGLVITERAWNRIPRQYRDKLKASIETVSREFAREAERTNTKAMNVMKENGLVLNKLEDGAENEWRQMLQAGNELIVGEGKAVSRNVYEDLVSRLEKMR